MTPPLALDFAISVILWTNIAALHVIVTCSNSTAFYRPHSFLSTVSLRVSLVMAANNTYTNRVAYCNTLFDLDAGHCYVVAREHSHWNRNATLPDGKLLCPANPRTICAGGNNSKTTTFIYIRKFTTAILYKIKISGYIYSYRFLVQNEWMCVTTMTLELQKIVYKSIYA